jgi:multicomponent Na+:H+ antiporter subunit C
MSSALVYLATAAALVGLGVYGVLVAEHVLRKLLALNLLGSAVFLLLVVLGDRGAGPLDPVPQALVLTGMVVAVATTALALAILLALYRRAEGADDLDSDDDDVDAGQH